MMLIDSCNNEPVQLARETSVSHHDVVRALTARPSRPEPVVLEDFDAELRRWLLSHNPVATGTCAHTA